MGLTAGSIAAAATSRAAEIHAQRTPMPNVVYLFSDEHRYQSMACSELPEIHTPHMARLTGQGISFTHCISNYPVCSPYRAILMTGRWPYQQGVIDNNIALSPDEMTIGKAFQAAGYRTGYIGKWHLGGLRAEPFGFEHSLIWSKTNTHYDRSEYHPRNGTPVRPKGYNATLMTDQAIEFMTAHRDEPFFLMVSWNPPHSNFLDAPKDKKAQYPEDSLPRRQNTQLDNDTAGPADKRRIWKQNDGPHYRGYHAHVTAIDEELGRITAKLDELGIAQDTIVVYTSDHGSMLGSHGLGSKRQPYEESIRVPFLIRWPGTIPPGKAVDRLFGTIDIMPTLCSLARVPVPETCVGLDFSQAIIAQGGPTPESQPIMHISKENASGGNSHPAPIFRGVRTPRHTYAVYPDRPWCLFDNDRDPYQLENLIDDPDKAELRTELHKMTAHWLAEAEDPFELPLP